MLFLCSLELVKCSGGSTSGEIEGGNRLNSEDIVNLDIFIFSISHLTDKQNNVQTFSSTQVSPG